MTRDTDGIHQYMQDMRYYIKLGPTYIAGGRERYNKHSWCGTNKMLMTVIGNSNEAINYRVGR
jgi:hypothetical protein